MDNGLSSHEEKVRAEQFPDSDLLEQREDLIFVFPGCFSKDGGEVANQLQSSFNFLKDITSVDPTTELKSRVVIGFTKQSTQPNWSGLKGNRIHLPWNKLSKSCEPQDACSHELIHPFYRCSPIHDRNEGWGDGFCDFLRGPLKNKMGLDGNSWWEKMIEAGQRTPKGEYSYPAGQLVLKLFEKYGDCGESVNDLIKNKAALKSFIKFLFCNFKETSLSSFIKPSPEMINKWNKKGKI